MLKLMVKANGATFTAEYHDGAGFASTIPDGENRTWAEQAAAQLFEDRRLSSVEDEENLRGVAIVDRRGIAHFGLSALNGDNHFDPVWSRAEAAIRDGRGYEVAEEFRAA